jgi:hypothetical protein
MSKARWTGILLGGTLLLGAAGAALAQPSARAPRSPVVTTPHFAFYNDFDTNLNDALVTAGAARTRSQPELFHAGDEVACFAALPASARAGWEGAVRYYQEIVSPASWSDRQQYLLRVDLAGFSEELEDAGGRQFVGIARSFRGAAAPAYRACRWAAQDEKNRRWIEELRARLAAGEAKIAPRLETLYGKPWGGLPIPVDVVETVDWSGANSILRDPAGGHLLVSVANEGPAALEVVFHEASHLLMGRGAPLREALDQAARAVDFRLPGALWHVVLFYTTGETVRRILADGGKSGYTPMVYGIFDRGTWVDYRGPLESAWRPYIAGEATLSEAAARLMGALRKAPQKGEGPGRP